MWWSYPGCLTKYSMEITVFLTFKKPCSAWIPPAICDIAVNGHPLIAVFWEQQVKCHMVWHRTASQQRWIQLEGWHYSHIWHHRRGLFQRALPWACVVDLLGGQGDSCPTLGCAELISASLTWLLSCAWAWTLCSHLWSLCLWLLERLSSQMDADSDGWYATMLLNRNSRTY